MIPEEKFEGYRVDEVLSRSSTTTVYRAWQFSLERPVLIKELRPELFSEKDLRDRFEREAQVCARIKHENIVGIYQITPEQKRIYLVMEFVEGYSLEDLLRKTPNPPVNLIYAVIIQTLRGLVYAHDRRVIHRDLKPGNILISRDGWVKITDFGLARVEGDSARVTRPGAIVGTPAYLSPEVIRGGAVTHRSDIFSLGVTFYQLLTGQKIFDAEHFSDTLNKVLSYHPPKPSQQRPDIPPELDRMVLRMLQKQPEKRWESCRDIVTELESVEGVEGLEQPKQYIQAYLESPEKAETMTPTPREIPAGALPRRKRAFLWLGAAVVLILVMAGVFLLEGERPEETQPVGESLDSARVVPSEAEESLSEGFLPLARRSGPAEISAEGSQVEDEGTDAAQEPIEAEPRTQMTETKPREETASPPEDSGLTSGEIDSDEQFATGEPLADLIVPTGPSYLRVRCDPWADVYIDGIHYGKTPLDVVKLESGQHRLVFRHPEFAPLVQDIDPAPQEEVVLDVNFWETVGRLVLLVTPWAEVHVDGELIDVTPLKEPLVLPLGTHIITLKNPALPPWETEINFERGAPPCTLKVNLAHIEG